MRVLVTGAAGFLGSHICDQFDDVIGVDNLQGGDLQNVPDHVEFYQMDLMATEELFEVMENVDVVYHTACFPHEGLSVFSPAVVTQSVSSVAASVFSAAIQAGVGRIIHCTSMARYGDQQVPFYEDMPTKPQDPYGIAKVAAEELLVCLAGVHGFEYVIAVPHNIVGRRQRYYDPYRNVVAIMCNRVLQGDPPIVYGDGSQTRCFSHVDDVIQCLTKMIEVPSGEVINIGPDEGVVTLLELAERVIELLEFDRDPIFMPGRPQEVKHAICSSDKARDLLGYRTTKTLDDMILDVAGHIQRRGVRPFDYHLPLEIVNEQTPITWRDRKF